MGSHPLMVSPLTEYKMRLILFFCLVFSVARNGTASGLGWPSNRYLPAFSAPAAIIDCIDTSSSTGAEQDLFASLEGIVNRAQPRIGCVSSSAEEGEFTWFGIHNLTFSMINGYSAVLKYETNVTGLVVTDPNQPDTLDLATTIAGVKNELICDPSLLGTLTNPPYSLSINDDLRGMFSNKYGIYQYLYSNYWTSCTHRIIAGMETNGHGNLRDYLVAVQAASVWLDPGVPGDAAALAPFVSQMTPLAGVYMGWWPSEDNGLSWIAQYGIPVVASDWFENGSLFAGVASAINVPPIPPAPPLQNKVYVSMTLSDGDNVQYMQHYMKVNWGNSSRGRVPIGWTSQPIAADLDPGMLNYYWSTATTNDCLVAGPSGAGYTRINFWNPANVAAYAQASAPYLQRSGMTGITVWSTLSMSTASAYAANCRILLGLYDFGDGGYTTNYETLPAIGFPGSANYAATAADLVTGITNMATGWNGSKPMFVAVEGDGWDITPSDCVTVANALSANEYVIVRPDQLFVLYRQWAGLVQSGAPRAYGNLPASLQTPAGYPLALTVYPLGAEPMSYQWQLNGSNLVNSSRIEGSQSATLTINPAFGNDAGHYQVIISNSLGSATSAVCNVSVGRNAFTSAAGWSRNGNAGILTNNSVELTDGHGSEASSVFLNYPEYVGAFVASFTYQDVGKGGADGCAFVLQNASADSTALGAPGGSLGCSGITPSFAMEFNIYSSYGVGMALSPNSQIGTYNGTAPVNLAGGNPINVSLSYNGTLLSITLTDTVTHASFSTNAEINLFETLGSVTAYVGMTAADGGISSTQIVSNFQFTSFATLSGQATSTNTVVLTWPNCASGLVLQQASGPGSAWSTVTNVPAQESNGSNQVTIAPQLASSLYRLATP